MYLRCEGSLGAHDRRRYRRSERQGRCNPSGSANMQHLPLHQSNRQELHLIKLSKEDEGGLLVQHTSLTFTGRRETPQTEAADWLDNFGLHLSQEIHINFARSYLPQNDVGACSIQSGCVRRCLKCYMYILICCSPHYRQVSRFRCRLPADSRILQCPVVRHECIFSLRWFLLTSSSLFSWLYKQRSCPP